MGKPTTAPVATEVVTPVATPVEALVATPVAAPVATPVVVPVATPVAAPIAQPIAQPIALRALGRRVYGETFDAMRAFTRARDPLTPDELWLVEHDPVFTLGQGGRLEHLHDSGAIPVARSDRGGQVTYHGPGQAVVYALIDLQRRGIRVREFVTALEAAVIDLLVELGLRGLRVSGAPGVYVRIDEAEAAGAARARGVPDFRGLAKVAALGIKVSAGRSYHGLALNVDMDLAPFASIDPCGYPGLRTLDLRSLGVIISLDEVASRIAKYCAAHIEAASRV